MAAELHSSPPLKIWRAHIIRPALSVKMRASGLSYSEFVLSNGYVPILWPKHKVFVSLFVCFFSVLVSSAQYAEETWKGRFNFEKVSMFPVRTTTEKCKHETNTSNFWICVWGKQLRAGKSRDYHVIAPLLPKSFRFQNVFYPACDNDKPQRFHHPPVWRAFSKNSVFVTD